METATSTGRSLVAGEAGATSAVLEVISIGRRFGGVDAVADMSLRVPRAVITGLIGPNGAGKSTLIGVIGGAIRPNGGRILFEGADVTRLSAEARARRGLIRTFQLAGEFQRLTVLENLVVAGRNSGESVVGAYFMRRVWRHENRELLSRALDLLNEFGLYDLRHKYAGELSGGQRRMVEIMRAVMAKPRMLLLDEPTAGVNRVLRGLVEERLMALREGGLGMLLVEHEMSMIRRCCDNVVVMARGRKLAEGSVEEIQQDAEVRSAYLE